MSEAELIWRNKTDDEILAAAACLDEYTEDGRRIILEEARLRRLPIEAVTRVAAERTAAGSESNRCAWCDTRILFGGVRQGPFRFCNDACRQAGIRLSASRQFPDSVVNRHVSALFNGPCPQCGGPGPVDVHTSHRAVSALVLTWWSNRVTVSCRPCATRARLRDTLISLGFGWWALHGIIMTPVQIARNIKGLLGESDPGRPSARLEKIVRAGLVERSLDGHSDG